MVDRSVARCTKLLMLAVFLCSQGAISHASAYGSGRCPVMNGAPAACRRIEECPAVSRASFRRCRQGGYQEFVCCPTARKSEQACQEYRKRRSEITTFTLRVLLGSMAKDGVYTHMAAIGVTQNEKLSWVCGGTLISNRYVLTAAHCMRNGGNGNATVVRLGRTFLTHTKLADSDYPIEDFIAFPSYRRNSRYYDMALLKLGREVQFSGSVYPACLYTQRSDPRELTATGWGATLPEGVLTSTSLLEANLTAVTNAECREHYKPMKDMFHQGLREDMLCARGSQRGADTCEGDSGGPLQILEDPSSGVYSVVAITNFGTRPCGGLTPSVYLRVFSYLDWIESIVWP